MRSVKIVIPYIPPSNNLFLGNSHNFNVYRKEKERWHMLIRSALYRAEKPSEPFGKAEVYVHYYFGDNRRRDPDNYSGKMLLDPLVSEGVLKDDSFRVIRLFLSAETDKKRPRTEIIVNEIE